MPPPRKVDRLPADIRAWLQAELKGRGFGDYVALTEDLNFMLEERGEELRLGKSAVHAYGQEYAEFVKYQEEAGAWAASWMADNGLEEEAQRHNVLFQMVTTLAFKVMAAQMNREGDEIDPKELHFIGRMLKDVMQSSGIREKLVAEERERVAEAARDEERRAQAAKLDDAAADGRINAEAAQAAREIMGFL